MPDLGTLKAELPIETVIVQKVVEIESFSDVSWQSPFLVKNEKGDLVPSMGFTTTNRVELDAVQTMLSSLKENKIIT